MIGKLVIFIAILVLLAGIVLVAWRLGVTAGKAAQRRRQDTIDPMLHEQLKTFVRNIIAPPATFDDIIVLPETIKRDAQLLHQKIGPARRAIR